MPRGRLADYAGVNDRSTMPKSRVYSDLNLLRPVQRPETEVLDTYGVPYAEETGVADRLLAEAKDSLARTEGLSNRLSAPMQERAIGPATTPYRNPLQKIGGALGSLLGLIPTQQMVPQYVQEQEPDALRDLIGATVSPAGVLTELGFGSVNALRRGAAATRATNAANKVGRPAADLAPDLWSKAPGREVANMGLGSMQRAASDVVDEGLSRGLAIEDSIAAAQKSQKFGKRQRQSLESLYGAGRRQPWAGMMTETRRPTDPNVSRRFNQLADYLLRREAPARSVGAAAPGDIDPLAQFAGPYTGTGAQMDPETLANTWETFQKFTRGR